MSETTTTAATTATATATATTKANTTTASSSGLPAAALLAPSFDAERLQAELGVLTGDTWRRQRTYTEAGAAAEFPGDWRVLPLRSPGGDAARTDAGGPGLLPFRDTRWLEHVPYFAEVLRAVPARLRCARLMALGPGASVGTHRDTPMGFAKGLVRVHVPVTTNDNAVLVLDGETHRWQPGTCWYGDFSRPHSIANTGETDRVHLVLDCAVTRELYEALPGDYRAGLDVAEVLFDRPELPLRPAELPSFAWRFMAPGEFLHWSGEPLGDRTAETADALLTVTARPEGLVLSAAGEHAEWEDTALVHVGSGEFRLQGWTEERTLHLDRAARTVRFVIRDGSARTVIDRPLTPPTAPTD